MLIVNVYVSVLPGDVDAFLSASLANASASVDEPGIVRFDVLQQTDDPTQFLLVEIYRSPDAALAHKETQHYKTWRVTVDPMMAAPRRATKYQLCSPVGYELPPSA